MTGPGSRMRQAPRWLVSIAVMLTTIMAILDMTIVNVALPHMMGALGARVDQITWVLTSYIVSEAVVIPLSGTLSARFGRRRVMLVSISGFIIASALCGISQSLSQIVLFRILQGAFGAPLIPLSQSVMIDAFPASERGRAMALWGMGIMLGPVLGPTLGGYITQHLEWRWVFYINVPLGLLSLLLVADAVGQTPTQRRSVNITDTVLMVIGIAALQTALDRGNQDNWFDSAFIVSLFLVSVASLTAFAWRAHHRADPVLDLKLLRDRNLALASFMMMLFGLGLFGTIALQPIMLERLLDYPAQTTGLVMAPRALGSAFSMLLVSRLMSRIQPRLLVGVGLMLAATGTWLMTRFNLQVSAAQVMWPGVLQGLGMGLVFVPLATSAYETLPKKDTDAASGIYNLARTLGSSMGISLAATLLSRRQQINWNTLGGHITTYTPALNEWLSPLGLSMQDPRAAALLSAELNRQSLMLAFDQVFIVLAASFMIMLPVAVLLRPKTAEST